MVSINEQIANRDSMRVAPTLNVVVLSRVILGLAIIGGAFLRIWQINAMGFNTDEAVYAGQAAAIAGVPVLKDIFPIFRAHPLLFQFLLSLVYRIHFSDILGRYLSVAIGLGTVYLTYQIGKTLYGRLPGALAAAFLALMPYHVIVSRQVLLDGPMTFFTALTLFMLARFGKTQRGIWLYAAGGAMGLAVITKETSIVILGGIFAFLALAPEVRTRLKDLFGSIVLMVLVIAPFPLTLLLAGGSSTGRNYLIWQLFRRPNHDWPFYLTIVPPSIGILVIVGALVGIILLWRKRSWREKLLLSWIIVPFAFFQLWPVKGFQYLLPIAIPFAVLAGRTLGAWIESEKLGIKWSKFQNIAFHPALQWFVVGAVILSLGFSSWQRIQPEISTEFLAGTGGVPGGREAGAWIKANVPMNAEFMTIGPSMANIVSFYGQRPALGLSVSPNPLHRNPSYDPIINPDLQIRSANLQYIVWDSFSASRSSFFSEKLMSYVTKYNGRVVHTESITVNDAEGNPVVKPVIIIYEVHP